MTTSSEVDAPVARAPAGRTGEAGAPSLDPARRARPAAEYRAAREPPRAAADPGDVGTIPRVVDPGLPDEPTSRCDAGHRNPARGTDRQGT
ncbi:hypothetical protein [Streptomyces sp. NPDC059247]|uniref:hypothetical protein n=1 Tax=Streptomyces sp. NPDC059247 TaxID=3346790 RepID=UPI0036C215C7